MRERSSGDDSIGSFYFSAFSDSDAEAYYFGRDVEDVAVVDERLNALFRTFIGLPAKELDL